MRAHHSIPHPGHSHCHLSATDCLLALNMLSSALAGSLLMARATEQQTTHLTKRHLIAQWRAHVAGTRGAPRGGG